jgi:hypothetical protein
MDRAVRLCSELRSALVEREPPTYAPERAAALAEQLATTEKACGAARVRMAERAASCGERHAGMVRDAERAEPACLDIARDHEPLLTHRRQRIQTRSSAPTTRSRPTKDLAHGWAPRCREPPTRIATANTSSRFSPMEGSPGTTSRGSSPPCSSPSGDICSPPTPQQPSVGPRAPDRLVPPHARPRRGPDRSLTAGDRADPR